MNANIEISNNLITLAMILMLFDPGILTYCVINIYKLM